MLRNDWFIEDPQNEETVTLLALVINISPFTQTRKICRESKIENVSDFFFRNLSLLQEMFPRFCAKEAILGNSV